VSGKQTDPEQTEMPMSCRFLILLPAALALLSPGSVLAQPDGVMGRTPQVERQGEAVVVAPNSPEDLVIQRTNRPDRDFALTATAAMIDRSGQRVGDVAFVETPNGLLIQVRMDGVPAGGHGLHVHENGRCDPPTFQSAGGHYAGTVDIASATDHGYLDAAGPHAGDLPNVYVQEDGVLAADMVVDSLEIEPGVGSLLPSGSKSIVLHAQVDDYATDPAGSSGDRIACGVIMSPIAQAGLPEPEQLPGR